MAATIEEAVERISRDENRATDRLKEADAALAKWTEKVDRIHTDDGLPRGLVMFGMLAVFPARALLTKMLSGDPRKTAEDRRRSLDLNY